MFIDPLLEGIHLLKTVEISQAVYFFKALHLDAIQDADAALFRSFQDHLLLAHAVMIRHGDQIETFDLCHVADIVRRHRIIGTWRQAAVNVEIVMHQIPRAAMAFAVS